MNRPDKETLRRVIRKMHRQNDCEKFIELASVFTGMLGKLNFHSVEFASDDPYHPFPLYILKSASNLNGNLNCSKELEHYAS